MGGFVHFKHRFDPKFKTLPAFTQAKHPKTIQLAYREHATFVISNIFDALQPQNVN